MPCKSARVTEAARFLKLMIPGAAFLCGLDAAGQENEAQSSNSAVEEIVVYGSYTTHDKLDTATGLGLSIRETPQSVSVMTAQRIEDQNLKSLTDVVVNATGISSKELDSSRDSYSARGFDIDNYQLDGVPISWSPGRDAGETQTDTALYERVEIVRGATGLLTGAGNPSASVNLVRKHADSREFNGSTSLSASRWDTYDATMDVSTPLNADGSIRGRSVVRYQDGNSYVDYLGNEKTVLYGVVDANVTDATLLRVGASHQDNDPTASTWGGLPSWYGDGSLTDWSRSKTIGADWTRWASTVENYFATMEHEFLNSWTGKINLNYADNSADLHLLYLYGSPDKVSGLGLAPYPYRSDTKRTQSSVDAHLSGTYDLFSRKHEFTVGYTYSAGDEKLYAYPYDGTVPVGDFNQWNGSYPEPAWGARSSDIDLDTRQSGLYAASRLSLTESLKVVLGGRLSDWKQNGTSYGSRVKFGDTSVFIPYAGVLYDFFEYNTAYFSYTEIFKPQNSQDRNGNYLDPVVGEAYEFGVKSAFFDGGLHTTAALFRIEQDNLAQPDTGYLISGTIFEASRAAQGARSEGFELEAVGELTRGWEVSISYTQFTAEDAQNEDVNTSQPRTLTKLFTTYHFPGRWENLAIGGGINWEGSNYTRTFNPVSGLAEKLKQDSYSLINLMARYEFDERLSAQINVENLADEKYYSQIGFYNQLAYGEPRNVSVQMKYRF